jgi:hypothetical protein
MTLCVMHGKRDYAWRHQLYGKSLVLLQMSGRYAVVAKMEHA